jgi:hypothetical protein
VKLTRRQLAAAAAGSAVAVKALAQSAPAAPGQTARAPGGDSGKAAPGVMQRNADALAKFAIPVSTEPAFHFKA